jgi:hypothetical protein
MIIYSIIEIHTNFSDMVKLLKKKKQNTVEFGDIIFNGSYENLMIVVFHQC